MSLNHYFLSSPTTGYSDGNFSTIYLSQQSPNCHFNLIKNIKLQFFIEAELVIIFVEVAERG